MVFQPQKPQGCMLGFGDILLSTSASLSSFSLTSIIAFGYKKNLFSPLFSPHLTSAGAKTRLLCLLRRASCSGGKGKAGTRPAAASLPVLILQPLPSAPSVAAVQVQSRTLAGRTRYLRESSGLSVDRFCKRPQQNNIQNNPQTPRAVFCAVS